MMATISNFTLCHSVFKTLNTMSYLMGIDCYKIDKVCHKCFADPNSHRDVDDKLIYFRNPVE